MRFGAIGANTKMVNISADDVRTVAHLEQVDTEGVPPTTRAVEVVNVTRDDAVTPTPVREDLLDLAPEREGDFVRVPKILAD
jgi:aspartyl-tRNA(Asn)/glutamyl-tRNA(Gln) amidotransferase subunit C